MTPRQNIRLIIIIILAGAFFLLPACAPQSVTPEPVLPTATIIPVPAKKVLRIWNPESPTTLNPYLTDGVKDFQPSRIVYEPLASFNEAGELIPILAAEVPSRENGGLPADGKSVTWLLRRDVHWSDGEPFTADDVLFTYSYITDPDVKAKVGSEYSQIAGVDVVDDFTIKITFKDKNPAWALPFVGIRGVILPRHIFENFKGASAREAPANKLPIGTGPYQVKEPGIKPQEVILLGLQVVKTTKIVFEPNPNYRFQDKLAFRQIVWYGGGDTTVARRQLLEEGSLDVMYGFPIESLDLLGDGSKAKLVSSFIPGVDQIYVNRTDPFTPSADGEYSSVDVPHPLFGKDSDKRIRQAFAYAINRDALAKLYGVLGKPAYATLIDPPQFRSSSTPYKYDRATANALLDEVGYVDTNGDGFREKDGENIKIVFVTFVDRIALQEQKLIQKDLEAIGIDVEARQVDPSIMFSYDTTNQDSEFRFNADLMMFNQRSLSPDPSAFLQNWTCIQIPQKSNNWTAGNNDQRWCNPEYDDLLKQANIELNNGMRRDMFLRLNDMLTEDVAMIPLVWPAIAYGVNADLGGLAPTPWDTLTWNVQDWYFANP
jgi:peptide/nickel transport system substrate-binding protein